MRNILIMGGSYFAGRIFVEEMVKKGTRDISVFNRGRYPLCIEGITELVGDREDTSQINNIIPDRQWDTVVDFCAYTPEHIRNLLQHIPGHIKHYIFISTTTVYKQNHAMPIREDAPKLQTTQQQHGIYADYGYQKWLAECELEHECKKSGIPYTILRPAIIYGPYNYAPRESWFFDQLIEKKPLVIPAATPSLFSFIYVVDMAQIICLCTKDERVYGQSYNLASDELISYPRLVEVLGEITGLDLVPEKMSITDINNRGIPLPFPIDEHLLYSGEKIRRLFDFNYTPFIEGMRETLGYYLTVKKMEKKNMAT